MRYFKGINMSRNWHENYENAFGMVERDVVRLEEEIKALKKALPLAPKPTLKDTLGGDYAQHREDLIPEEDSHYLAILKKLSWANNIIIQLERELVTRL